MHRCVGFGLQIILLLAFLVVGIVVYAFITEYKAVVGCSHRMLTEDPEEGNSDGWPYSLLVNEFNCPTGAHPWTHQQVRHFDWRASEDCTADQECCCPQPSSVLRFFFVQWGSRGDLQPALALAWELAARGHNVTIAHRARYASLVARYAQLIADKSTARLAPNRRDLCPICPTGELRFVPLVEDQHLEETLTRQMLHSKSPIDDFVALCGQIKADTPGFWHLLSTTLLPFPVDHTTTLQQIAAAAKERHYDVLVSNFGTNALIRTMSDYLGIPSLDIQVYPAPVTFRRPDAYVDASLRDRGPFVNFLSFLANKVIFSLVPSDLLLPELANDMRQLLHMPPIKWNIFSSFCPSEDLVLISSDPLLWGSPLSYRDPDWTNWTLMPGRFALPQLAPSTAAHQDHQQERATIETFIQDAKQAGSPIVYIGCGSMVGHNRTQLTEVILKALLMLQQQPRLILMRASFDERHPLFARLDPSTIYWGDHFEHDTLFPQLDLLITHGGGGHASAIIRSGAPSISMPLFDEQIMWSTLLENLGASKMLSMRKIETGDVDQQATQIAEAMSQALIHPQQKIQAQRIAQNVAPHGVQIAADHLLFFLNDISQWKNNQ